MIDLKTIDENLAKAKDEVAFWEKARSVFLDPRISTLEMRAVQTSFIPSIPGQGGGYGELKRRVYNSLPDAGSGGVTTSEIVERMTRTGYTFVSSKPHISVNEALVALKDAVEVVGKRGVAKLWTKAKPKAEPGGVE